MSPPADERPFATERVLLLLALPISAGFVAETLHGVIDTVLVGRLTPPVETPLAAAGIGRMAMAPLVLSLGALLYGTQAFVGRRVGAGRPAEAGAAAREALRLALAAGIPVSMLACLVLGPVLAWTVRDPDVREAAATYLGLRLLGLPAIAALLALRGFLYGIGRPGLDFACTLGGLGLNLGLSTWWVFGGLGVPALGVAGAALGTLVAESVQAIVLALLIGHAAAYRAYGVRGRGSDPAARRAVLRLSAARAVQGLVICAFPGFLLIMEKVGVVEAAAANLVFTAHGVFFFVGFGVGVAGGSLAAQALGAGDPARARRVAAATARVAVASTAVLAGCSALVARPYLRCFTDDPVVRAAALGPFLAYCAFLPLDACGAALAKVLVAAGAATYVMVAEIVAGLLVFLPVAWLGGVAFGGGAWGAWAGFAGYIVVFGGAMAVRIAGRAWSSAG